MRTGLITMVSIALVVVFVLAGCVSVGKKQVPVDDAMSRFVGVWVNREYSGDKVTHPQKLVMTSKGRVEGWYLADQPKLSSKGTYKIVESWTDSKGNTYCKVDTKWDVGGLSQELWRLDKSGKFFESNFTLTTGLAYPKKIDANPDPTKIPTEYYGIWYRQE